MRIPVAAASRAARSTDSVPDTEALHQVANTFRAMFTKVGTLMPPSNGGYVPYQARELVRGPATQVLKEFEGVSPQRLPNQARADLAYVKKTVSELKVEFRKPSIKAFFAPGAQEAAKTRWTPQKAIWDANPPRMNLEPFRRQAEAEWEKMRVIPRGGDWGYEGPELRELSVHHYDSTLFKYHTPMAYTREGFIASRVEELAQMPVDLPRW